MLSHSKDQAFEAIRQARAIDQKASGLLTVVVLVFTAASGIQVLHASVLNLSDGLNLISIIFIFAAQILALIGGLRFFKCLRMLPEKIIWVPDFPDKSEDEWKEFTHQVQIEMKSRRFALNGGARLTQYAFLLLSFGAFVPILEIIFQVF